VIYYGVPPAPRPKPKPLEQDGKPSLQAALLALRAG